jgi:hypothetical protein
MRPGRRIEAAWEGSRARTGARARAAQLLACLLWFCLAPLCARAEPLRVLLLGAPEAELTARVHGQTRDLPLVLQVVDPGAALDSTQAAQLGREHAAQVVVWSEATGSASLRIYVLDLDSGALRARDVVAHERETLAASTTAEIAALVVRSELSGSLAERDAALAAAASAVAPPPAAAPPSPAAAPAPAPAAPPGPWLLGAGYRFSVPVVPELVHAGALTLRRDIRAFALGLSGYGAGPLELERDGTEVRVLRFGLRLEALWGALLAPQLKFWLGGGAGCTGNARSTRTVASEQRATEDALSWSGNLGPQIELHWQPLRYLGLALAGGVDIVLWRTKFAYEDAAGQETLELFSRLEPWLLANLYTRFGR